MRKTVAWLGVLALLATGSLRAQAPTQEGTVIHNTATVSFTDANGNTYTDVSASVDVTVGLKSGITVTSPATATPAAGSTGNELVFTIQNSGNATNDQVSIAATPHGSLTITGYILGGTTYAPGDLNAALATTNIPYGGSITVTVVYTVAAGTGGQTLPLTLTATSIRQATGTGTSTTNVIPPITGTVTVTPDPLTADRLPSNGVTYTVTYHLTNPSSAFTFDLTTSTGGSAGLVVSSVNGTAGTTGTVAIGAGASADVVVVYTVPTGAAAAATGTIQLTATAQTAPGLTGSGTHTVTVIRPNVTLTKDAFASDHTSAVGTPAPGDAYSYRLRISNTGSAPATLSTIADVLPAALEFVSGTVGGPLVGSVSATGQTVNIALTTATLAVGASADIWIEVRVR